LDSHEKSICCARLAGDKKANNIVILELRGVSSLADFFIICSGTSDRHVQAIANHIETTMKKEMESIALGVEGLREGRWVLLDYDDVIIHVFQEKERALYDLESLWTECPRVPFYDTADQEHR